MKQTVSRTGLVGAASVALSLWIAAGSAADAQLSDLGAGETPLRATTGAMVDCTTHLKSRQKQDPNWNAPKSWRAGCAKPVPAHVTPEGLQRCLETRNPRLDKSYYRNISKLYRKWGERYGLRWDYAFYQMLLETNSLKFTGGVRKEHHNFNGNGAAKEGGRGSHFPSVDLGRGGAFSAARELRPADHGAGRVRQGEGCQERRLCLCAEPAHLSVHRTAQQLQRLRERLDHGAGLPEERPAGNVGVSGRQIRPCGRGSPI